MKLKPYVSFALRAIVTPSEETARGDFQLGDGKQNIIIPDDADQMLAITFVLDPAAEVDKPSGLYIEPATGQAEIHAGHVPAGWTATELTPGQRVRDLAPPLPHLMPMETPWTSPRCMQSPFTALVRLSFHPAPTAVQTGRASLPAPSPCSDFLATIPNGVAVAADEQIQIVNGDTVANTVTLVVLGKR